MNNNLFNSKKIMPVLSILFFIFSLGVLILLFATGHKINFLDFETFVVLIISIIYFLSGVLMFVYIKYSNPILTKIIILLLILSLISLFYWLYLAFEIQAFAFETILPLAALGLTILLTIKVLSFLLKIRQRDNL